MKSIFCFFGTLLSLLDLHAQHKVSFILNEKTTIRHDSIYVTGTFSNWDSTANRQYLMKSIGENKKSISLNINAGTIRYKFHRGSWFSVEKQYNGFEASDHVVTINSDTVFVDSVSSWRDEVFKDKYQALVLAKSDTHRVRILAVIARHYAFIPEYYNSDSALFYANTALALQQTIISSDQYKIWVQKEYSNQLITLREVMASLLHSLGNYPKSLEIRLENLKLAEKDKDKFSMVWALRNITDNYAAMKDYQNVLRYGKLMDSIVSKLDFDSTQYQIARWYAKNIISSAYYHLRGFDSALHYAKIMPPLPFYNNNFLFQFAMGNLLLADIYSAKENHTSAFAHYRSVINSNFSSTGAHARKGMARLFQKEGRIDSALFYARQSLAYFQAYPVEVRAWGDNSDAYIADISPLLAELYKAKGQMDSAYKYLQLSVTLKDNLYNSDKIKQFQTLTFNEAARLQQLEQQNRETKRLYDTKVKIYGLITVLVAIMILAIILYRNNKHKQKANTLLKSQKEEIETTFNELKLTQKQLIQSEKMASLGELTAGIAHEIQNPLNFVNNFSELSTELVDEMNIELENGNLKDAKHIAQDLRQNLEKINHHGRRAGDIVKGMLQHSRSSSGQKEPTNINALADEYMRLAYYGLRAKDNSFSATLKTDYDESIGNISIIPQDIGRAILNLITNAFYVVREKNQQRPQGYEPTVSISTRKTDNQVEIEIADNGNGIPQNLLDKIFQPFFTTKPAGQGTGLGLSLAYDIITKGHGGKLKVQTKEGDGSNFIITLPVK